MKISNLSEMIRGWFVGGFTPSAHKTNNFEVAIKEYKAGDHEDSHYHKIATEVTVIVSGEVKMNNTTYKKGDIIVIHPGESTDFIAITDVVTVVVKEPFISGDKYNTTQL